MAETNEEQRRRLGISDGAYREGDIIIPRADGTYSMRADPNFEYDDDVRDGRQRGGGGGRGGGGDGASWFDAQMGSAGFGGTPEPFGETYTAMGRPSWLQGEYVPGQWTERFAEPERPAVLRSPYALPTRADLEASPGYLAGADLMQRGMERSAAAKGTILSGGFVGRALPRAMGEYAGGAYQNLVGNTMGARQQQYGEYSGDVSRAFDQYRQRYGQFADAEGVKLGARHANETAYQTDVSNERNQYLSRYNQYLDRAGLKRQAETDLWGRNMDLTDVSLRAAALARP